MGGGKGALPLARAALTPGYFSEVERGNEGVREG